nr:hypothetical protein [Anaerolineaceae bacterium]
KTSESITDDPVGSSDIDDISKLAGIYEGSTNIPEYSPFPDDTLQENSVIIEISKDGRVSGMVEVQYENIPNPSPCVEGLCCQLSADRAYTGEFHGTIDAAEGIIDAQYSIIENYYFEDMSLCQDVDTGDWVRTFDYPVNISIFEEVLSGNMSGELSDSFDFEVIFN